MINKLTKEQEKQLEVYRDKWLKIGLSTEDCDRNEAEKWCKEVYKIAGLQPPEAILWTDSPISGAIMAAELQKGDQVWDQVRGQVWDQVWDQVGDQVWDQVRGQVWDQVWDQVRDQVGDQVWDQVRGQVWDQVWDQVRDQVGDQVGGQVYGAHDAFWLGYYNYFLEVCNIKECEKVVPLMELAKNCGWWAPYKEIAILQEKPEIINMKDKKLHCSTGPAIEYRDGFCVYAINGKRLSLEEGRKMTSPVYQALMGIRNE